ncbi:50S ribosomal protein L11 methyltransferase [Kangiella koreensis]|uniref:Ribosomal protein L11 methyltransferase n=1 Tax=Kangiella koreensis (strain DSM 16069 / JCM 12317 / KCTC 12182 / SW-125) TaxID=523791 RepID=C7R7C4_KANKD|nr:50S ribosomal protein L11 methyltransferase [Kangiella koreensis]ACV25673.1 ribosomal protein L11 methyltransferase [Kangiella koreensis DSM 16069]
MAWIQLKFDYKNPDADSLSDYLMELGALAVTFLDAEDKPILEPKPGETPLWEHLVVLALFEADIDTNSIDTAIQSHQFAQHIGDQYEWEIIRDQDWERSWMDNFKPMQFGQRVWIVPSWCEAPEPDAVNIKLDPGLAFGTGTHATTALCLQWLDGSDLTGKTVIDYGCGSGILAIAALLLGAEKVYAVDIDPQAIEATKQNLQRNGINSNRLVLGLPEQVELPQTDILVANILAEPLRQLAESIANSVQVGGNLVLSGLLETQAAELNSLYSQWFEMDDAKVQEDWARLSGTKKS